MLPGMIYCAQFVAALCPSRAGIVPAFSEGS